jgi:hypothetical protein
MQLMVEKGEKTLINQFFPHGFVNNYWYAKPEKGGIDHRQNNLAMAF